MEGKIPHAASMGSSTMHISYPGKIWYFLRISAGITICPLESILAVDISLTSFKKVLLIAKSYYLYGVLSIESIGHSY